MKYEDISWAQKAVRFVIYFEYQMCYVVRVHSNTCVAPEDIARIVDSDPPRRDALMVFDLWNSFKCTVLHELCDLDLKRAREVMMQWKEILGDVGSGEGKVPELARAIKG